MAYIHGPAVDHDRVDWSEVAIPTAEQLEEMLVRFDAELTRREMPIPHRPLQAFKLASIELSIPMPLFPRLPRLCPRTSYTRFWPISEFINNWYKRTYGKRLEMSAIGRVALLLRGQAWVLDLPDLYGGIHLIASRRPRKTNPFDVRCNALDSLQGLADGLRASLTEAELKAVKSAFELGFTARSRLEEFSSVPLIQEVSADIDAAVDHLLRGGPADRGLSKWASLQAAEKAIKATIQARGKPYDWVHSLKDLLAAAKAVHVDLKVDHLVGRISCSAGVRYGQEAVSLVDAESAHHASLAVVDAGMQMLRRLIPFQRKERYAGLHLFDGEDPRSRLIYQRLAVRRRRKI